MKNDHSPSPWMHTGCGNICTTSDEHARRTQTGEMAGVAAVVNNPANKPGCGPLTLTKEARANIRLIVASPKLLMACRRLLHSPQFAVDIEYAKTVIAEATKP